MGSKYKSKCRNLSCFNSSIIPGKESPGNAVCTNTAKDGEYGKMSENDPDLTIDDMKKEMQDLMQEYRLDKAIAKAIMRWLKK